MSGYAPHQWSFVHVDHPIDDVVIGAQELDDPVVVASNAIVQVLLDSGYLVFEENDLLFPSLQPVLQCKERVPAWVDERRWENGGCVR